MNPLLVPEVCPKKQTNKKPGRRENLLISGKVPNRIHAEATTPGLHLKLLEILLVAITGDEI